MKKIVSIIAVIYGVLFGALPLASAATIYTENWGSPNTTVQAANTLGLVGWTVIANRQGGVGPYYGIYAATGASDPALGLGLPVNTVYFTALVGTNQLGGPGMFYTTSGSGSGTAGNSAFANIDPTLYTNLTFNVEVRGAATDTNYFAVQVGGSWYVSTQRLIDSSVAGLAYPNFTNATMLYTNVASAWRNLTLNAGYVTIGSTPGADLSGPITGIGIVELENTNFTGTPGFNYNEIVINQGQGDFPSSPPANAAAAVTPQHVYVGGGASFLPSFSGTPTLIYRWQTNGVNVTGTRFLGANSTMLTITNASTNDALWTYSVAVTNFFGKATNGGMTLIVSNVPAGLLYAETFPYVGPNGNLPITGVGWASAASGTTAVGIYQDGPGVGDVFSYSPAATTNVYFTTVTNDTGLSGLPFAAINPASYPAITLQAGFVPGNGAGQVPGAISVYWAVAMNGTWYSSAQPVQITLTALSPYLNYQLGFNPAATNWNNLTITSTGGIIGSQASGALAGNITGAGLVIAHNTASGSDMNFQNFEILTNQFVGTAPSIGTAFPLSVGVASGGGASFGVSATGTQPFTYGWTTNGVPVQNGGRVSGATTATLTIANLNSNDNNMQIVAFVTNSAGFDESDSIYGATTLTVTNPPVGLIYSEQFPFVGPLVANYPISSVGWVEAVPSAPNALFQTTANTSEGAVFAYLGVPGTTVYYATTATDTNQAGLPFPNINLASYPSLNFSVDIAPSSSASNVTAFVAVQLNGTNWYVAASSLAVPTSVDSATYATYTMAFNPAAANWKNLTVTSSGGLVGSTAASNLSGVMTGAGLVFVTVGTGGNFNFDNYQITGTGLGGINVGPLTGGNINLSWVGNPAVNLQSTTNLIANWQDVPNTLGLYSLSVPVTGPQKFFRLVQH
jgi:hypothetical protein